MELEVAARVQAWVEDRVSEALASEVVQHSLEERLEEERRLLEAQVGSFQACSVHHAASATA